MTPIPLPHRLAALRGQLSNPVEGSLLAVGVMPLLSLTALGLLVWRPLGVLLAVASIWLFPRCQRRVRAELTSASSGLTAYVKITLVSALLSIPVAQVFFRGDLRAMAAPFIAAEESGGEFLTPSVPIQIFGPTGQFPSYGSCQWLQDLAGVSLEACYSSVGYLHLWQMPVALPTLLCITLLYIGIPLTVARYAPVVSGK